MAIRPIVLSALMKLACASVLAAEPTKYTITFQEGALAASNVFDARFLAKVTLQVISNAPSGIVQTQQLAIVKGSTLADQFWFPSVNESNALAAIGGHTNVLRSLQLSKVTNVSAPDLPTLVSNLSAAFSNAWPILTNGTYSFISALESDPNVSFVVINGGKYVPTLNIIAASTNQPMFRPALIAIGHRPTQGIWGAAGLVIHPDDWPAFSTNLPSATEWKTNNFTGVVTIIRKAAVIAAPGGLRVIP